jgi:hypothetical protein
MFVVPLGVTADAAAVIAEAERALDERLREYIRVRFAGSSDFTHMRLWVIAGLPTGIHRGRGVEKLILNALGHTIGIKSLQRDLRCTTSQALTERQVIEYRDIVQARIDALRRLAMEAVERRFREKGWVK